MNLLSLLCIDFRISTGKSGYKWDLNIQNVSFMQSSQLLKSVSVSDLVCELLDPLKTQHYQTKHDK